MRGGAYLQLDGAESEHSAPRILIGQNFNPATERPNRKRPQSVPGNSLNQRVRRSTVQWVVRVI